MLNGFLKLPILFKKIVGKDSKVIDSCYIYPPSINDSLLTENFSDYVSLLAISQPELEDELEGKVERVPTPLEYVLTVAYHNKDLEALIKKAFYFFTKKEVSFIYDKKEIWFCNLEDFIQNSKSLEDFNNIIKLEENNYLEFQNKLREALGRKKEEPPDPDEDPRVKRIKRKARLRDKIKAKQKKGLTLEGSLASICCMGMGLNPLNIGDISLASINPLIETYQNKEKYQIDVDSLLAGAKASKVDLQYWMKNPTEN